MRRSLMSIHPEALGRGVLLGHLVLSPLLFSTATAEGFEFVKVSLLTLTAIVLGAIGLVTWIGNRAIQSPLRALLHEPIALGFVLLLFSAAVSTATSMSPRTSWQGAPGSFGGLLTVAGYAVLFFATRGLCRGLNDARYLLAAPVIAAGVAATYAVVQAVRADPLQWDHLSSIGMYVRPYSTLGHPNFLAAYLVMAIPVALYFALEAARQRGWLSLSVCGVVCLLAGLAVLLAMSRGAWLALVCTAATLALGWGRRFLPPPLERGGRGGGRRTVLTLAALPVLMFVGLGVAYCIVPNREVLFDSILRRLRQLHTGGSRQLLWQAALALFYDYPLFGCGLDTFRLAFMDKRTVEFWLEEWNTAPLRAHNEALHILATRGLVGAAALVVLTLGLLITAVRATRQATSERRLLVAALGAGVVAFYVQNAFSFTVAGCGTLFVTYAALISRLGSTATEPDASPFTQRRGYVACLVGAGFILALTFAHNVDASPALPVTGHWSAYLALALAYVLVALAMRPRQQSLEERAQETLGAMLWRMMPGAFQFQLSPPKHAASARTACFGGESRTCLAPDTIRQSMAPGVTPLLLNNRQLASPARQGATSSTGFGTRLLQTAVWLGAAWLAIIWVLIPVRASVACRRGELLMPLDAALAIDHFEQAVALENGNAHYWAKLGAVARKRARWAKSGDEWRAYQFRARHAYESALERVPVNPYYHAALGRVLMEMVYAQTASPEEAFAAYDLALAGDRSNVYYYVDAANSALALNDLSRAKSYTARGLDHYPDFGVLRAQLGYIAIQEKRHSDAVRLLGEALGADWHGEVSSRRFAQSMLTRALQFLSQQGDRR